MYQALSLKNGQYVSAEKARYDSSRSLLLICPECGEPVYFKFRQDPNYTYFFAHYKEKESLKLARGCSLRVFGAAVKVASDLIPGLSHGQLVNRFQKEFCSELFKLFGRQSSCLSEFIQLSGFHNLDKKDYVDLINQIAKFNLFGSIASEVLKSSDTDELMEGLAEVCQFLKSPYGVWVGNFLYQVSYFLACMIHPDTLNKDLATSTYTSGRITALFVVEPFRLKQSNTFALEVLSEKSRQNKAIPRICSALVSMLILKWRFPKFVPRLFLVADHVATDSVQLPTKVEKPKEQPVKLETAVFQEKSKPKIEIPEKLSPSWLPPPLPLARPQIHYKPRRPIAPDIHKEIVEKPLASKPNPENSFTGKKPHNGFSNLKTRASKKYQSLPADELKLVNKIRVIDLIFVSKNLKRPDKVLTSVGAIQSWSKCSDPVGAYFLAAYLDVPYVPPDESEIEISKKVRAWVKWAKSIK